jgi:hypothetical protein
MGERQGFRGGFYYFIASRVHGERTRDAWQGGGREGGREGETQSIRNCEDDGKNNKHKGAP